jgi:hypothetical protein
MSAYSELQEKSCRRSPRRHRHPPPTRSRHRHFNQLAEVVSGGAASTLALNESTEADSSDREAIDHTSRRDLPAARRVWRRPRAGADAARESVAPPRSPQRVEANELHASCSKRQRREAVPFRVRLSDADCFHASRPGRGDMVAKVCWIYFERIGGAPGSSRTALARIESWGPFRRAEHSDKMTAATSIAQPKNASSEETAYRADTRRYSQEGAGQIRPHEDAQSTAAPQTPARSELAVFARLVSGRRRLDVDAVARV